MLAETDETLLLDLLNTTPVIDGAPQDELSDAAAGHRWLAAHGRPASDPEWRAVLEVRSALQDVVRGDRGALSLAPFVSGVRLEASLIGAGVTWTLDLPEGRSAAAL